MQVVKDDGTHRHLAFSNNGSFNCAFDLITWPGSLCISGDCGTYSFSRIEDMFQFFRSRDEELKINPAYWGEKLTAVCSTDGFMEYSPALFEEAVKSDFENWEIEPKDLRDRIWADIKSDVLSYADDGEVRAYDAAAGYESESGDQFVDFWEHELRDYTHRYIWNLYAIVWGIQQYDKLKEAKAA